MKSINLKIKSIVIFLLVIAAYATSAQQNDTKQSKTKAPKYIFYFIGDGLGLSQSNATETYLNAISDNGSPVKLHMNTLPYIGFYTTYAADRFITGSAAAGTALSTGYKTSINTIAMDTYKQIPLKTVAELAKEQSFKVGIITSVSLDHATPATFYAHQPNRNMYYNISLDLSNSQFDYFAGGGFKHPEGDGNMDKDNIMSNFGMGSEKNIENKEVNSYKIAISRGYKIINSLQAFKQLKNGDEKVIVIAPNLAGGSALPYSIDQENGYDISLADFTRKGIELLENNKGFFMMVEGGKIDWACHANDAATVIKEVIQFDNAIAVALEFYQKHPEETLIIVTGDHETGGLALGFAGSKYNSEFKLLQHQNLSYESFSKKIKQYLAQNDSTSSFSGAMTLVTEHFGLGDSNKGLALSEFELQKLKRAYEHTVKSKSNKNKDDQYYLLYGNYDPFTVAACHILSNKAGIGWTSYSHTAVPVPIRSIGLGAHLFTGYFDNTDIAKRLIRMIEEVDMN